MSILEKIKCNNCNYEINGRYCSHCGQEVKDIDSSFLFALFLLNVFGNSMVSLGKGKIASASKPLKSSRTC